MIKVLINQYRAKADKEYNKIHGILPSIVIYPRYGVKSLKTVMEILHGFFYYYVPLGCQGSHPTYFRQVDKLVYYSNGLNDLKMYARNVIHKSNNSIDRKVIFNNKYTNIDNFEDPYDILP